VETREFKAIISKIMIENGFFKRQDSFYKKSNEIIFVVGLQKSGYSKSYYVNIGYIIRQLHPEVEYPHYTQGDVRARFGFRLSEDQETDIFNLEDRIENQSKHLERSIVSNIKDLIDPVEKNGMTWLLKKNPVMLYQTTKRAKEYLKLYIEFHSVAFKMLPKFFDIPKKKP